MSAAIAKLLRIAGLLAVIVIAILSLVPMDLRPQVAPKLLEHFAAYAATGMLLALAFPQWGIIVLGLSCYSAALELAQMWIPGRTASIADFASSSLGVCLGVLLVWVTQWVFLRPAVAPSSRRHRH
jgi:VanZ family protein